MYHNTMVQFRGPGFIPYVQVIHMLMMFFGLLPTSSLLVPKHSDRLWAGEAGGRAEGEAGYLSKRAPWVLD